MILRMMPNFSKCFLHFQKFIFLPCSHQSKHYLPNLKATKQTYKNICETQANRSSIMRSVRLVGNGNGDTKYTKNQDVTESGQKNRIVNFLLEKY